MNPCPELEHLRRLLSDALPLEDRSTVEVHIEKCPQCQQTLAQLTEDPLLNPSVSADPSAQTPLMRLGGKQAPRLGAFAGEPTEPLASATDESVALDFLAPPTRQDALGRLGHYEVLQVLGRGGFGIVFRAFDDTLQRVVAIKVLTPELAATSPARKRFLREARAAAQVRHEHVVQIYAVEEQPLPYLVMEFIPGETLQQRLDRRGPFEAGEVTAVGQQMAAGLAAAHAAGLIHRDVKPANVLLDEGTRLQVKLTDFGLARAADDASLTQSGAVAGTPLYMSPEQARGERLDHRSDLFSLGCVLYAIASGRPPFRAGNALAVLKRVTEDTPRPIQEIIPETPDWLCGVVTKLMAKDASERYQTAAEVSADLEAGLSAPDKLVIRPSAPLRKRHPRWFLFAGGAMALVAAMAGAAIWLTREGDPNAGRTHFHAPEQPVKLPTPENLAARPAAADALKRDAIPPNLLAVAERGDSAAAPKELVAILGGPTFRHRRYPAHVRYSPDGTLIVTREDWGSALIVWDAETGQERFTLNAPGGIYEFAFSPDGKFLAATVKKEALIWDLAKRTVVHTFRGHTDNVRCVNFSPNGERLVTTGHKQDRTIRVWDIAKEVEIFCISDHGAEVPSAEFSRDGAKIVSAACDNSSRIWDAATGKELVAFTEGTANGTINSAHFDKEGQRVVCSDGQDTRVFIWSADSGKSKLIFQAGNQVYHSVFSPDGKWIASCGIAPEPGVFTAKVWLADSGKLLTTLKHAGDITCIAFSADGKKIATAGALDLRVRIWDSQTGEELTPAGHDGPVNTVAFSSDGKSLASGGADGSVRLWDMATGKLRHALAAPRPDVRQVVFSPDNMTVAAISRQGALALWTADSGKLRHEILAHSGEAHALAFSPDGALWSAGWDHRVICWDTATGEQRRSIHVDRQPWCIKFNPAGDRFVLGDRDGRVSLWDRTSGTEVNALSVRNPGDVVEVRDVAFHPEGRLLALGCAGPRGGSVLLCDLSPLREKQRLTGDKTTVLSCAWRADGNLLVTACYDDGAVRLWDPTAISGPAREKVLPIPPKLNGVALSPEGRHLATANLDGTIYVLRLANMGEVFRVP